MKKRLKMSVKDNNPLEYWLRDIDAKYENTVGFSGWYGDLTFNNRQYDMEDYKECFDSYYCERKFGVVMGFCI